MGWWDYHLYLFQYGKLLLTDADTLAEWGEEGLRDDTTPLNRLLTFEGARLTYEYDFGDSWQHELVLEVMLPEEETAVCSKLLDWPRLANQHFLGQVIDQVAVAAAEGADEAGQISNALHRQRGKLQTGDQPSMRASNACTSATVSGSPITACRKSAASAGVKRNSAARSSRSWPRMRSLAKGSGGSARLVITRGSGGGK